MRNCWILLLVVFASGTACSPAGHVIRTGMDNLVPAAARPAPPVPLLDRRPVPKAQKKSEKDQKKPGEKSADVPTDKAQGSKVEGAANGQAGAAGKVDAKPEGKGAGADVKADAHVGVAAASTAIVLTEPAGDFEPKSGKASMVPASGDVRKRLVRSASRLVGIKKSFDERSFLGHVLAINDLLPKGASSVSWTADDQIRAGRKAGRFKADASRPAAGDIVFFKCADACGADSAAGTGAGIFVDDRSGSEAFVAYRKGAVEKVTGKMAFIGYMEP